MLETGGNCLSTRPGFSARLSQPTSLSSQGHTEATEQTCPHLPKTVAAGSHLLLTRHTRVAEKIAETTEKT